jgi:thiol-disulfide isomerase/thioredoxin
MMRLAVLAALLALVGCKDKQPAKQPPHAQAPAAPSEPPLVAKSGPIELLAADGGTLHPHTVPEFRDKVRSSDEVVAATTFPDGLSALAGAGVGLRHMGKLVTWIIDGEPVHGFAFAFDENVNGDLRDDKRRDFTKVGDAWELTFSTKMESEFAGGFVEAPVRLRFKGGELRIQIGIVRRGTLPLPGGPMSFVLVGDSGQFGLEHHYLAFDLNRDGTIDLESFDNDELFGISERTVTLDDKSYQFEMPLDGSELTLRPLKTKLPPRPSLVTGAPAPDLQVTDLDGKPASLSALKGNVVLLDFWATSCHPCIQALPKLVELRRTYHDRGFEIMGIAMETDDVRDTLGEQRAGIEIASDAAQTLYRVDRFPTYFLVGRDGKILCSRCRLDRVESMIAEQFK